MVFTALLSWHGLPCRAQDAVSPLSREETVWREVLALCDEPASQAATQPADPRAPFDTRRARRQALLERVRLYQTLFPGGAHRDEAARLELDALFEIGSLSDGQYGPLCERAALYLQNPPSDAVRYEAAYWAMLCERLERVRNGTATAVPPAAPAATSPTGAMSKPNAPTQPSYTSANRFDPTLLAAYQRYVEQYPRSPYAPRLAETLFEDALRRNDRETMRTLARRLAEAFPEHAVTNSLQAQLRREDAHGQPLSLTFQAQDGKTVDTKQFAGKPVLIVVWAGFSPAARECVRRVEAFRQARPEIQVVGVNLDETRADLEKSRRELGIDWPQFHDGLLWANEFTRAWGVREVPFVFVLDRAGRLRGTATNETWEILAGEAFKN